ncbi:Hsp70 family protein [Synechococcus elongatus IITB5]
MASLKFRRSIRPGREQTVTIQGASTLSQEVKRMMKDAELYAQQDRQLKARIEKRNRAQTLIAQSERRLREISLDFGLYFAESKRRRIESTIRELKDYLERQDDRGLDLALAELQDALFDLNQETAARLRDEGEASLNR